MKTLSKIKQILVACFRGVKPSVILYDLEYLNFADSRTASEVDRYRLLHTGLDGPSRYLEAEVREAFGPNAEMYVATEMGSTYAKMAFSRASAEAVAAQQRS